MGFAVVYQGIIWGVGKTQDDAIDEALYCLNLEVEPHERMTADDILADGSGWSDEDSHPTCLPATDALVRGIMDETFDPEGGVDYKDGLLCKA
jgi:hypothetical protein